MLRRNTFRLTSLCQTLRTNLIRSVVDYQVHHKFHLSPVQAVNQIGNVSHCAVGLMNIEVVGDIVTLTDQYTRSAHSKDGSHHIGLRRLEDFTNQLHEPSPIARDYTYTESPILFLYPGLVGSPILL